MRYAPEVTERTQDPDVVIEARDPGFVRYRNTVTGRRWEVHGRCTGVARCIVGAVVDGKEVKTLKQARAIWKRGFFLDCPVTPEFSGCCPFRFKEL